MDDWKKAAQWLLQLGVVMPDHRIMSTSADTIDLLMNLRDGVLLCQLLNHLHPRAVNLLEINYSQGRTQMSQFLCIRNIRIFLQACSTVFNIGQEDLFEPMWLYEATNFKMVLQTLSKLSNTRFAIDKGARPFYLGEERIDDDIYGGLGDDMDKVEDIYSTTDDIYAPIQEEAIDEDIYDDLVSVTKRGGIMPTQEAPTERRDYCLNEISETEGKYVEALTMIKNEFISPLKLAITREDKDKIFCNIEELLKVHSEMYDKIQDCFFKKTPTIGSIFINFRDKLLIYGEYVSKLTAAQDHIDILCSRDLKLRNLIEKCQEKANGNRFNLRSLLSLPMQRMLKYHLLFVELNKRTNDNHPEKDEIFKALQAMKDLSDFCNEVKRDYEQLETLQQIQKSLVNYNQSPVTELGRLHLDGELKIRINARKAPTGAAQKSCFLFDKALLVCKGRGMETHDFQYSIELEHYDVEELPKGRGKWSYCFYLQPSSGAAGATELNSYEVATKTLEMMNKWVSAIMMSKENISPPNNTHHQYVYHSFPHMKATYCAVCKKLLRGMLNQGYKCSDCQIPVHKECIRSSEEIKCQSLRSKKKEVVRTSYEQSGLLMKQPNGFPARADTRAIPLPVPARENLSSRPWYQEGIDRDRAREILENSPTGTFIIRFRDNKYALSLKFDGVKHMRIISTPSQGYYLQESTTFNTIEALVEYYKQHPLNEVFNNVNTVLAIPFRNFETDQIQNKNFIALARALYDFSARDIRELSLQKGDLVQVTIRPPSDRGWWKGRLHSKEGYFPASYVEVINGQ
ncbi:guanine nucleotide exchange factor VAV3-like isoform X2 [Apostichopus japonicus]|uniref:guanine nucleotide exchange factor VAV3-like isoform X2 n=1 Tax=Stichopus japonicus TaxID=307972 RepID=UPI003AB22217